MKKIFGLLTTKSHPQIMLIQHGTKCPYTPTPISAANSARMKKPLVTIIAVIISYTLQTRSSVFKWSLDDASHRWRQRRAWHRASWELIAVSHAFRWKLSWKYGVHNWLLITAGYTYEPLNRPFCWCRCLACLDFRHPEQCWTSYAGAWGFRESSLLLSVSGSPAGAADVELCCVTTSKESIPFLSYRLL